MPSGANLDTLALRGGAARAAVGPMSRARPEHGGGGIAFEEQADTLTEVEPRRLRLDERDGAVILLSGGVDSATVLAIARGRGIDCHTLTVDYEQRHRVELEAARRVAMQLGAASHRVVSVDLRALGGSALTDDIDVPRPASHDAIGQEVPATYVPARNTLLLALALAWAEILEVTDIFIGANVRDYSGYPDCRPVFLRAFEKLANLGTRAGSQEKRRFQVHAPLVESSKSDIIRKGVELGVNYALTHSCYDPTPDGLACGICDACILRRRGFQEAGVEDPTRYAGSD